MVELGHWLKISTIGTSRPDVNVYDSMYPTAGTLVKAQTAVLHTESPAICLQFMNVQMEAEGYGHMEKQETEIKRKLEMGTGNRNWKRKPETENRNGNKRCTNHWCSIFFIVCLVITQVFYLAIVMVLAL